MGMSYEDLETALARQGKANLELRAEVARLMKLASELNAELVRIKTDGEE